MSPFTFLVEQRTHMKQFISLIVFILFLPFATATATATECSIDENNLGAEYQIKYLDEDGKPIQNKPFTIWRTAQTVLHVDAAKEITTQWYLSANKQLKKTRFFDHYQRGIEYQQSKKVSNAQWQLKRSLVSKQALANMVLIKTTGLGCEQVEHYQKTTSTENIEITWLPQQKLIKNMKIKNKNTDILWSLVQVYNDEQVLDKVMDKVANYQTTDFADIGDNEADPFLAKMINLGFVEHGSSGFYDSQGNSIENKHHH